VGPGGADLGPPRSSSRRWHSECRAPQRITGPIWWYRHTGSHSAEPLRLGKQTLCQLSYSRSGDSHSSIGLFLVNASPHGSTSRRSIGRVEPAAFFDLIHRSPRQPRIATRCRDRAGGLIERARGLVARGRRAGPSTLLATVRKSASIAATLDAQRAGFAEGVAGRIKAAHVRVGPAHTCPKCRHLAVAAPTIAHRPSQPWPTWSCRGSRSWSGS
jgi:hypothetical protein